ncbi:hypothetical protein DFQ27_006292 [Actinomortierella ambigua]|uniref:Cytochrome P450 n=1 Tax=Actinomortierella ambigua TaxID=1343610 RepID=A0A9P6U1C4_9FUNG|nr:hypothetical protein DFQ27_006292 [Actinomortierella ambigua]
MSILLSLIPSSVSILDLQRAIDRYMVWAQNQSRLELGAAAVGLLLVGAMLKWPDRAIGTRARPDLKGKGDRGLPLVGNLFHIIRAGEDSLWYLDSLFKRYGNVVTFTIPGAGRFVDVNTPEAMQHILRDNFENYEKGDFFAGMFADVLGAGIFVANGTTWRIHRKTAANIFTTRLYRDLVQHAFKESANELGQVFDKYTDRGVYFDLQNEFTKLTLDAFGKLTFGIDFKALLTEGHNEFGDAFDYMTNRIDQRLLNPFWRLGEAIFPSLRKKVTTSVEILNRYAYIAIEKRRKETEEEREVRPKDLLDHFIGYKYEDGSKLTDEELRDVFVNFMIAGRDTTSQALTWMFWLVMKYPQTEAKLLEEIEAVFRGTDEYTYEALTQDMPYTKAVFYETLRLFPPVPKNGKVAVNDDVLPDGTKIYAKDVVGFSTYCMHRNPEVWGPDAAEFVPERWLLEDPKAKSPFGRFKNESLFKFNSFNAGPRLCLGQTFATLEAMVTTVYLLQNYRFELQPNHPEPIPKPSVTCPMKDPLMVRVLKR